MDWKEFLSFRRMITPVIIKFLFWIGVAVSVLGGIFFLFASVLGGADEYGAWGVLFGLGCAPVYVVLGILAARIYSELLIVVFQINETLTDIRKFLEENKK